MNKPGPLVTPRLFAVVVGVSLLLLFITVVAGLISHQIDPTGVATVLATLISGVVVGALVRGRSGNGEG